jgi:hypothetical protein
MAGDGVYGLLSAGGLAAGGVSSCGLSPATFLNMSLKPMPFHFPVIVSAWGHSQCRFQFAVAAALFVFA